MTETHAWRAHTAAHGRCPGVDGGRTPWPPGLGAGTLAPPARSGSAQRHGRGPGDVASSRMTAGGWLPGGRGDRPRRQRPCSSSVSWTRLGVRGSDALDRSPARPAGARRLRRDCRAAGSADPGQGPGLLRRRADLPGDGERLAVMAARLPGRRRSGRQLAEAVQRHGLAVPRAEVTVQLERLAEAGGGGRVVAGRHLHAGQPARGPRPGRAGRRGGGTAPGASCCGGGGRVVARLRTRRIRARQRAVGLVERRAEAPEHRQRLLVAGRRRRHSRPSAAAPGPGR